MKNVTIHITTIGTIGADYESYWNFTTDEAHAKAADLAAHLTAREGKPRNIH